MSLSKKNVGNLTIIYILKACCFSILYKWSWHVQAQFNTDLVSHKAKYLYA
jgi:hypothetical protein